jgi:hypothetical protein
MNAFTSIHEYKNKMHDASGKSGRKLFLVVDYFLVTAIPSF